MKICEEVSPDEMDRDICNDELPLEDAVTEGESQRFVPVGEDVRAACIYQMCVSARTTTTMNHGLFEEGSAAPVLMRKRIPVRESSTKSISGERGYR